MEDNSYNTASVQFSSFQSLGRVRLFAPPWVAACQASVHHQLPEFTQTLVHRVGDATQPSPPLSSPSHGPNPSQHQSIFQWVYSSHDVAKVLGVSASASVLPMNIQDWFPLGLTGWVSLQSKGLSRVFSNTTVKVCSLYTHFLESFYPKSMLIFVKAFFWIYSCNYIILL